MTRLSIENLEKREMMSADSVAEAPVIPAPELPEAVVFDVETDGRQPLMDSSIRDDFAHLATRPLDTEGVWDDTDIVHVMRTDALGRTSLLARDIESDGAVDRAYTSSAVLSLSARRVSIDMQYQQRWLGSDKSNAASTYLDVNGDGVVSPIDALLVMSLDIVNQRRADGEGTRKPSLLLPAVQFMAHYFGDDELDTYLFPFGLT